MELAVNRERGRCNTELAARNRFGKYKDEKEQAARLPDVKEDKVLEQFKAAWKAVEYNGWPGDHTHHLSTMLGNLQYSADDVEKFSIAMAEFQDEKDFSYKAGIFLSTLINNGEDDHYLIHTNFLAEPLHLIGYSNEKNITVNGSVGKYLGRYMVKGKITVKGDAGRYVGSEMKGGEIHIDGDLGEIGNDIFDGGKVYHKGELILEK